MQIVSFLYAPAFAGWSASQPALRAFAARQDTKPRFAGHENAPSELHEYLHSRTYICSTHNRKERKSKCGYAPALRSQHGVAVAHSLHVFTVNWRVFGKKTARIYHDYASGSFKSVILSCIFVSREGGFSCRGHLTQAEGRDDAAMTGEGRSTRAILVKQTDVNATLKPRRRRVASSGKAARQMSRVFVVAPQAQSQLEWRVGVGD